MYLNLNANKYPSLDLYIPQKYMENKPIIYKNYLYYTDLNKLNIKKYISVIGLQLKKIHPIN
jgi:hypothetical protein